MVERPGPSVFSIAAHRGFADALVAGMVPRYETATSGLAKLTLILPSSRARQVVSEAFIRHYGASGRPGLIMPRMAVIGDLDLDESLGLLFDPLAAVNIPAAVDPVRRMFALAEILRTVMAKDAPDGPGLFRLARDMARTMDRLLIEDIAPEELVGERVLNLLGDLSIHWQRALRTFIAVQDAWLNRLREWNMVDAAQRRNHLFIHASKHWREQPPETPVVAAGVTGAAPALARLLRTVADLPGGAVVLPDFDLTMPQEAWDELGLAGRRDKPDDAPFGKKDGRYPSAISSQTAAEPDGRCPRRGARLASQGQGGRTATAQSRYRVPFSAARRQPRLGGSAFQETRPCRRADHADGRP